MGIAYRKRKRDKKIKTTVIPSLPAYLDMYHPTLYTPLSPPSIGSFCVSQHLQRKMTTVDNASVKLLSILIDIIISGIVMQSNLRCIYWRDVVFTLTAVAVFPSCFRVLQLVTLKCGIDHGFC